MQNQVKFLLVVLLIAALSSFLIPDRGTSGQHDVTSYGDAAFEEWFNESAIVLPNGLGNPAGRGNPWLLVAKKDDDGKNGHEAEEEEEEKDDKDSGCGGFDRLWDVTCCG